MLSFKKWISRSGLLPSTTSQAAEFNEQHCLIDAQNGDRKAFQQLLEHYYDMIYQVAYGFTGHSENAEDITQDVCVGLADKLATYRGEAAFKTWLYRLVINACLDAHRKNDGQDAKLADYLEFEAHERSVKSDNNLQIAWLYRQLATLNEPFKETAFLVLAQDLSHAEAGQILGCSESTVSWRMHEIRHKLKNQGDRP